MDERVLLHIGVVSYTFHALWQTIVILLGYQHYHRKSKGVLRTSSYCVQRPMVVKDTACELLTDLSGL